MQKNHPPGLPLHTNLALYTSILAAFFLLSTSWTLLLSSTYTLFVTHFVFGIPALATVAGAIYKTIQLIQPNFTVPSKWIIHLVVLYVAFFFVVGCFYLPLFGQPGCVIQEIDAKIGAEKAIHLCIPHNCLFPEFKVVPSLPSHLNPEFRVEDDVLVISPTEDYAVVHKIILYCTSPLYPLEVHSNAFTIHAAHKHYHPSRKLLSMEDSDYLNMKSAGYTMEEAMAIRKRQEDAVRAYVYKCAIVGTLCGFLVIFFGNFRIKGD